MKIVIDRAVLLRPLGHVQSCVERRNTIPILSNVLIRAADGALSLTATDMDMDIRESVGCDVAQSGETTLPAHTLYDIVRKCPCRLRGDGGGDGGDDAGHGPFRAVEFQPARPADGRVSGADRAMSCRTDS